GRVTVLAVALSREPGRMAFYVPHHAGRAIRTRGSLEPDANPGLDQTVRTVEVATLDGLDLPPLGFVKIDVEGHELAVLEGGLDRLRRDRPRLLIEIEERHHPNGSDRVPALLDRLGYEAFYWGQDGLRPLGETPITALQNAANAKPVAGRPLSTRGYVNNFLFLHRSDEAARTKLAESGLLGRATSGGTRSGNCRSSTSSAPDSALPDSRNSRSRGPTVEQRAVGRSIAPMARGAIATLAYPGLPGSDNGACGSALF
ncbi:MAG: FkbM family methyltransferase, partial [Geminicoccaceae bacterium]|nr:FkbM family methyltransferase [Geminicoccaceae bacterium]